MVIAKKNLWANLFDSGNSYNDMANGHNISLPLCKPSRLYPRGAYTTQTPTPWMPQFGNGTTGSFSRHTPYPKKVYIQRPWPPGNLLSKQANDPTCHGDFRKMDSMGKYVRVLFHHPTLAFNGHAWCSPAGYIADSLDTAANPLSRCKATMYAWNEQLAMDSQIDQTSGWSTILSQALWNRWWVTDPPTELVHSVKSHSHSQHYQDHLEPTLHQPPYCWQKVPMSPDTITQWEDMREFSSNLLWPSLDQDNLMETNGESPLVWTMLHPPLCWNTVTVLCLDGTFGKFLALEWTQQKEHGHLTPTYLPCHVEHPMRLHCANATGRSW